MHVCISNYNLYTPVGRSAGPHPLTRRFGQISGCKIVVEVVEVLVSFSFFIVSTKDTAVGLRFADLTGPGFDFLFRLLSFGFNVAGSFKSDLLLPFPKLSNSG